MKRIVLLACALLALSTSTANAQAVFKITELYTGGLPGPDGTVDWFELTNVGNAVGTTAGLYFDDISADVLIGGPLDTFVLSPFESAVFLIEPGPTALADFVALWGPSVQVGLTSGGGSLGGGGDAVVLFSGFDGVNASSATEIARAAYGPGFSNPVTIDFTSGAPVVSVLGVNGARESNPFTNTDLNPIDGMITIVGSPGVVPEPSTLVLVAVGLAGLARRRS